MFFKVSDCVRLWVPTGCVAKVSELGLTVNFGGGGLVAIPFSEILFVAVLLFISIAAACVPADAGRNTTDTVQMPSFCIGAPQVLVDSN